MFTNVLVFFSVSLQSGQKRKSTAATEKLCIVVESFLVVKSMSHMAATLTFNCCKEHNNTSDALNELKHG